MRIYRRWKSRLIGDYIAGHADIYDRAKAELLINTTLLVYLILLPIIVYTLLNGIYGKAVPAIAGLFVVTAQLLIFRKLRSTWWPSLFICTGMSTIFCVGLYAGNGGIHLAKPFWMLAIVVFSVFMMGVRWGIFFCSVLMTSFGCFLVERLGTDRQVLQLPIASARYYPVVETAAALFMLIYILSMFVITTKRSERALLKVNQDLAAQNQLVNKQNAEITVLLKEIHHRVKNNLQVITSLLRLQSSIIRDRKSRKVFEDAQYRVQAIALIHQRMYQSPDLSDIDPNAYFKALTHDLLRQYVTTQDIRLDVEVALREWQKDRVVPIGLLLNELIANSVEHGAMELNGVIAIQLFCRGDIIELHYSDNGKGFSDSRTTGFGLELIETLCAQLNGELHFETAPGKGVHYDFVLGHVELVA